MYKHHICGLAKYPFPLYARQTVEKNEDNYIGLHLLGTVQLDAKLCFLKSKEK